MAIPATASMVAEGCSTTAAAVAGELAATTVVAAMAAAVAAQGAISAAEVEGAAAWAASTPAGAATATKRAAEKIPAEQSVFGRTIFFFSIQQTNLFSCNVVFVHKKTIKM